MIINDSFEIKDEISNLRINIKTGEKLDRLHVESLDGKMNRDFWFTKDGEFDGTGSTINS